MKFKEHFSKLIRLGAFFLFLVGSIGFATDIPLTFKLNAHPSAVAIQFDVSQDGASGLLPSPIFNGASPHTVESAVVSSGATRFVVYSTTGLPISTTGQIDVSFSASELSDGMLTVSGVMASDAAGLQTAASPNSLPIIVPHTEDYRSQEVGSPMSLTATAYDLDGSVALVTFNQSGTPFSSGSSSKPALASWAPTSSGFQDLSVTASDDAGGDSTVGFGTIRAYQLSELVSFADFEAIHFGTAADPADLGFETAPSGSGLSNGLAWLLGINPNAPDLEKLPVGTVETNESGEEFVLRFNRLSSRSGLYSSVLESSDLAADPWTPVPPAWVTETPLGDGTVDVEVRMPVDPATESRGFLTLEASQTP